MGGEGNGKECRRLRGSIKGFASPEWQVITALISNLMEPKQKKVIKVKHMEDTMTLCHFIRGKRKHQHGSVLSKQKSIVYILRLSSLKKKL